MFWMLTLFIPVLQQRANSPDRLCIYKHTFTFMHYCYFLQRNRSFLAINGQKACVPLNPTTCQELISCSDMNVYSVCTTCPNDFTLGKTSALLKTKSEDNYAVDQ